MPGCHQAGRYKQRACFILAARLFPDFNHRIQFVAEEVPALSCKASQPKRVLSVEKLFDILFDSAVDSLVLAFLVWLMGSIAVGCVSGVYRDMTPSLPPGFGQSAHGEQTFSPAWNSLSHWFHEHHFAILFCIIFACRSLVRIVHYSPREEHRNAAALASRVYRRVSNQWFGLVVVNAFTAFGLAIGLHFAQQFSLTQLIWQGVMGVIGPMVRGLLNLLPGKGAFEFLEDLAGWYSDNQFKFSFWFLYSAAVCDDLGLPNYKALLRWGWRRVKGGANGMPTRPSTANQSINQPTAGNPKPEIREPKETRNPNPEAQ